MKNSLFSLKLISFASVLCGVGTFVLSNTTAQAHPYATCLTNDTGTISFRLNEAASNVKVVWNGGGMMQDLGPVAAGLTVTNLGVSGVYQVVVSSTGTCVFNTNSPNNAPQTDVGLLQGVAINKNPSSPYFGRVYVSNRTSTNNADGIFVFNSDFTDPLGQETNALNAGLDFSATGSPYRLTVGEDDALYISDWSDASGNLYVTDPNVTSSGYVLQPLSGVGAAVVPVTSANNHGSVAAVAVAGTTNTGNMVIYTVDEDLSTDRDSPPGNERNSLWQYPIGFEPFPSSVFDPTNILATPVVNSVSQTMDLARGPNGFLYMSNYRSVGSEPCVYVVDPAVGVLTNTLQLSQSIGSATDVLRATGGIAVSDDGLFLAVINIENNAVTVVALTNGIPDLGNRTAFSLPGGTGRGIAFDPANNLYQVSSAPARLQSLSLGFPSVATTSSDGSFELNLRYISISSPDSSANENGPDPAVFTITRHGFLDEELTVNFTLTGQATNGVDYASLPTTVTLAVGQASTNLTVTPVDDPTPEVNETVILTLQPSADYCYISPTNTLSIIDNDAPLVTITATITNMYERVLDDYVRFRVSRGGDIENSSVQVNLGYSGEATDGADFFGTTTVFMNPGEGFADVTINPVDDPDFEGVERIIATITPDVSYVVGVPGSATAYIVDDELPPETIVLFSDNFDTDTSANWIIRADAANGVPDYHAVFNYDYGFNKFVPPAPGDFTTTGLIITANKQDTTTSAAGVNLYPSGLSFSGNYALRFQMYIEGVSGAGTTEHVIFGINHSSTKTNWAVRATAGTGFNAATPGNGDGIWFSVGEDSSSFPGGGDWGAYTSVNAPPTVLASATAASQSQVFKAPPYRFTGTPASFFPAIPSRQVWVDVEVQQLGGVVTLLVNNTPILSFPNDTAFSSGDIMVGYNDGFGSVGGGTGNSGPTIDFVSSGFVVIDNLRVVKIGAPVITQTAVLGGNVELSFVDSTFGPYSVQAAGLVTGPYTNAVATITTNSPGSYHASLPYVPSQSQLYYRIAR